MLRIFCAILTSGTLVFPQEVARTNAGLIATFTQGQRRDALVLPNAALFVREADSPTLLLKPGDYSLELSGYVSVELRAQYTFRAKVNGSLELSINKTPVLKFESHGEVSEPSKPIRLNRGTNALHLRFVPPKTGDASFQLLWSSKNAPHPIPIPSEALSFDQSNPELAAMNKARLGLQLVAHYRCTKCHSTELRGMPELEMDAPDFRVVGSRLQAAWIARKILSPQGAMPRLFVGADAEPKANAIAAFLGTLKAEGERADKSPADAAKGEQLFAALNCKACHSDQGGGVDLSHVRTKFQPGALADYLKNPLAHYRWNPMPNFKLSAEEADAIAEFLVSKAPLANVASLRGDGGEELLRTAGCLNCHRSSLQNKFTAPNLTRIAEAPLKGCLSLEPPSGVPHFEFKTGEREAIQTFLKLNDLSPLGRVIPHEFAAHRSKQLHCAECHDNIDGTPHFGTLGGKLKPEWSERFIAGEISYKPRPWLAARMPVFHRADLLAQGLAALHGVDPKTPAENPVDSEHAATGAKLVSAAGGFSCVACHTVRNFSAGQVVESPGVNLAYSAERLLKPFYDRWVLNPVAIEPSTKMPLYFDAEGRSQLTEFFDGDGQKQIDVIWEYLRLGEKMPAPPVP